MRGEAEVTEAVSSTDGAEGPVTVVRLRRVGVEFGGRMALMDVSTHVDRGAVTVITGPNGAGKSTLLEVIAGVRAPSRGAREAAVTVVSAFVPQLVAVTPLLPVTVEEVIALGIRRGVSRARRTHLVDEAMRRLAIESLAHTPIADVSGGQRQRALLAQAWVRRPDIMLLDEPTTGLDAANAARIRQIIREEARRGAAVVCVSHDPAVRAIADRVIRLQDGRTPGDY
ncbi:zinc/manganese transport system ATP-binding protein [Microbacterium sp. AK009]|uniref:metal ABC transporter ATP-binding protein n=1 Tax=Microbacterium sp. AK009 TaxID=2723068 RepID=UPI0015C969FD|nr:ATP-binding cassette domain-containing protein [Microbacterium sp. AK009]NYF17970.1 zinc/manganese transport system ATP-binding protein [Microbacterium sp. AK009]